MKMHVDHWNDNGDGTRTGTVDNADGTQTFYLEHEDGGRIRFAPNGDGTRTFFVDKDAMEAAAMMETFAPDAPELSTEEFQELTEAMRQAREETAPDESGGSA